MTFTRGEGRNDPPPLEPTPGFRYRPSKPEEVSQETIEERRAARMAARMAVKKAKDKEVSCGLRGVVKQNKKK